MKKIFSFCLFALLAVAAKAHENTDIADYSNVIYGKDAVGQIGSVAKVQIWAKADISSIEQQGYQFTISLPDGWTVSGTSQADATISEFYTVSSNTNKTTFQLSTSKGAADLVKTADNCITTLLVNIPNTAKVGKYPFAVTYSKLSDYKGNSPEVIENIVSTIAIQRPEVIIEQSTDYAIDVMPFKVESGASAINVPVNFKNVGFVKDITFTIEYPNGFLTTKSGKKYPIEIDKSRMDVGQDATLTVNAANGTSVSFTNSEFDLVQPGDGALLTIPVTLTNVPDGLYTIKLKDIKAFHTDDEAEDVDTQLLPDYLFSVLVGESSDKDPILYGHYTSENEDILENLGDVSTIDLSVATVEEGVKLPEDKIIFTSDNKTKFTRSATQTVGTICVPFNLTSTADTKYFTFKSATANMLTFEEAATVSAGTPALFTNGGVDVTVDGYVMPGETSEGTTASALTFTGTYETKTITDGYYIAGGKFWDAATAGNNGVTIPAFRAYFEGSAAGIKSFNIALDETTGLRTITAELTNDPNEAIYDLSGRKLNRAAKGVNIVNGKKYLVK